MGMKAVITVLLATFCTSMCQEECTGGQVWTDCGSCDFNCEEYGEMACAAVCVEKCDCPTATPVWQDGLCIRVDQCPPREDPCEDVTCEDGQVCVAQEVACVAAPCHPVAQCQDPEEVCELEHQVGPCDATIPSWYYYKWDNNCKKFTYGGCEGNSNRFMTKEACERACQDVDMPYCPIGKALVDTTTSEVQNCGNSPAFRACPEASHFCNVHPADRYAVCCQHENMTKCHRQNAEYMDAMDAPSRDCDEEGHFERKQCDGFLGICYCITRIDGKMIPGSRAERGEPLDCNDERYQEIYQKPCLVEQERSAGLLGGFMPRCDENGDYERHQCHIVGPPHGECWCLTKDGMEVPGSRRSNQQELDCDNEEFEPYYSGTWPTDPCKNLTCGPGYKCEAQDVQCVRAPCPPLPVCVDLANQCAALSCMEGQVCKLKEVQCITEPCHPQPTCVDAEICSQEMDAGPCEAAINMWYYDSSENTCKQFLYGGCEGNGNRFVSKSSCEIACHNEDQAWCPVGQPIANVCCGMCEPHSDCPDTHTCHIHPADAFAVCCQRPLDTLCLKEQKEMNDPNIQDAPYIECDSEGNYVKKRCDGFMGKCYCVTKSDGKEIPGSWVDWADSEDLDCDDGEFRRYYNYRPCDDDAEGARSAGGDFVPECDDFGLYERLQCHWSADGAAWECWCALRDGGEIPGSRKQVTNLRDVDSEVNCDSEEFEDIYNAPLDDISAAIQPALAALLVVSAAIFSVIL